MTIKSLATKIEKDLAKATKSYESLVSTMHQFSEAVAHKMIECGSIVDAKPSKKTKKAGKKSPTEKKAVEPRKGSLLNHLVDILKDKPLTEPDIAKILLDNPEKYNWKNKSESTLYQTLRRGVKEKKIVESGERGKETKTYHVA